MASTQPTSDKGRRNTGEQAPVIRVIGLAKSYGKNAVHKDINLMVNNGEILTLMGGSGSGKSVLLRSLIGLEKPDRGEIYFHDQEITQLSEEDLISVRKRIAYVFQYGALFDSLTVMENLAYPLIEHTQLDEKQIRDKVLETLKKLNLEGTHNLRPADLSGGMQRRVGVARSIIMDPEIILYDEPTTGLDPYNSKQIINIMVQLKNSGVTAVLVTHDMHTIFAVSDRIAFLKDGVIAVEGAAEELRTSKNPLVHGFIHGDTM
ncbi:MAG: ABC transporter ATP-binding protein [Deltaproteobacteria bacterium]|nr:ABC transporter ATP-binding protein [Deltaproteobacteria bacterium]